MRAAIKKADSLNKQNRLTPRESLSNDWRAVGLMGSCSGLGRLALALLKGMYVSMGVESSVLRV